jgi:hypothetical protein
MTIRKRLNLETEKVEKMDEEEDSLERLAKRIIRINIKTDGDDYLNKIKNHLFAYLCFAIFYTGAKG